MNKYKLKSKCDYDFGQLTHSVFESEDGTVLCYATAKFEDVDMKVVDEFFNAEENKGKSIQLSTQAHQMIYYSRKVFLD
jgi:hypothetical protein